MSSQADKPTQFDRDARRQRLIIVVTFLPACWLGMQLVHELGHVLGAVITGSEIERIVLYPWTISRTDVVATQQLGLITWLGPLFGVCLPLAIASGTYYREFPGFQLLRFFAGFCLIANGAYLAFGSFDSVGDCGPLLRAGYPIWSLWLFGLFTIPMGLWMWHGLGKHFGIGPASRPLDHRLPWLSTLLLLFLLVSGILVSMMVRP